MVSVVHKIVVLTELLGEEEEGCEREVHGISCSRHNQ